MDHASTTPIDPAVLSDMRKIYENGYYNPGGLYKESVAAAQEVSESRKVVAKLLGTTSSHIVFTRGGTEGCNLAILGVVGKFKKENPGRIPHVIVSKIEHAAVLECVKSLEKNGEIEASYVSVDKEGILDIDELKDSLRPETILVSVMYVNNEIGTIQPIRDIAKLIRWYKKQNDLKNYPIFHTDAIQAVNYLDINVEKLGVDLMTLSGSKIYGPKSSGALYIRNREMLVPMIHGGDQEMGMRAGTEDVVMITGFASALSIVRENVESEFSRLSGLQKYFFDELQKNISDIRSNGSLSERIPNNINISISGISGERLVIELDAKGVCASSKSACKEGDDEKSHVIAAIRKSCPDKPSIEGSLRFSMGRGTMKGDIDKTISILREIVNRIKEFERNLKIS